MKRNIGIGFLLLLVTRAALAGGGSSAGNGGGAWVCRDASGTLIWAELVDLFESQEQYGLSLRSFTAPYTTIAGQVETELTLADPQAMSALSSIFAKLDFLKESSTITYTDVALPVVDDALYYLIPPASTCSAGNVRYEQIVNYRDDGNITVQRQLFESLSDRSKAALVIHEAVYALRRSHLESNSINSRRIVGLAFSTLSQKEISWELAVLDVPSGLLLSGGDYQVTLEKVNDDGSLSPLPNAMVMLSGNIGSCTLPSSPGGSEAHNGYTDAEGISVVNVPSGQDKCLFSPVIDVRINRQWYGNTIARQGWAAALTPGPGEWPALSCESITPLGLWNLHIVCVDAVSPGGGS